MFKLVLTKIVKNYRLMLCLLIGILLASSLLSSIPEYTAGILQKALNTDLEQSQKSTGAYPGLNVIKHDYSDDTNKKRTAYLVQDSKTIAAYSKEMGIPILQKSIIYQTDSYNIQSTAARSSAFNFANVTDFNRHIKLLNGRLPVATDSGEPLEVMATSTAMANMNLSLNETYHVLSDSTTNTTGESYQVKIVGAFEPKNAKDLYWSYWKENGLDGNLFLSDSAFQTTFNSIKDNLLGTVNWCTLFDYSKINVSNIDNISSVINAEKAWASKVDSGMLRFPVEDCIDDFLSEQGQIRFMMTELEIPTIILIIFYLFMMAQLIIEQDKQEIAVLKSRGASTGQIFKNYLIEGLLFGGVALVIGPLLGMLLTSILGSSNGFLSFVNRGALSIVLTPTTYLYALVAIVIFIVTLLFPAYFASKKNIVSSSSEKNDQKRKPFWQRYFLDLFLLAISVYGIYSYSTMANIVRDRVGDSSNLPLDPLLLIMASLFILSLALLFVRLYPFLIRLIFLVGKRRWSPSAYAGFLSVSRSSGREQFLIVFLIFSISVGILSSMAARTINTNNADRVKYATGADVVVRDSNWYTSIVDPAMPVAPNGQPNYMSVMIEPDYSKYSNIKGIASMTRVLTLSNVTADGTPSVNVYGIEPYLFGKTAWFRDDLLPFGWHYYLNELTKVQNGVLVSSNLKSQHKIGETLNLIVQTTTGSRTNIYNAQAVICGFVDYWPGTVISGTNAKSNEFVIANFDFTYSNFALSPYSVWMKKAPGVTSEQLYAEFNKKGFTFSAMNDTSQELLDITDDPYIQGQNGVLTINFLISMLIAALGFLIYWIMSIQSRVHEFGILRAMGLKFRELLGIIVLEQVLLSGAAVATGVLIGIFVSRIFMPFIQVGDATVKQSIPFAIIANPDDLIKILITIGCIIAVGGIVLGLMVHHIKMDQSIKLGED